MKQGIFTIVENRPLTKEVYEMVLSGDAGAVTAPGQFVNLQLEGLYLRRPISVCDWEPDRLTLVYKTVGAGTGAMSRMEPGQRLDILTGLGNGYAMEHSGPSPLLVGGGVGIPPLYGLCRRLLEQGKKPTVVLGFNTAQESFYEAQFEKLGARVLVATADGSRGQKGFVTDVIRDLTYSYFYACGPAPMYRAMEQVVKTSGQYSLEQRMGCGFGACMGCSIQTRSGSRRICKDGPVFVREELVWQT